MPSIPKKAFLYEIADNELSDSEVDEDFSDEEERATEEVTIEYDGTFDMPVLGCDQDQDQDQDQDENQNASQMGLLCNCFMDAHSSTKLTKNAEDDHWVDDCLILKAFHIKFHQGYLVESRPLLADND